MLQKFSPIEINCITLFPFVFARGEVGKFLKIHETIHFQQQLETGVIGFYIIYLLNYFWLRWSEYSKVEAYYGLLAEKEAYRNELDSDYLLTRTRWKWIRG
jgi:hypothetical protein